VSLLDNLFGLWWVAASSTAAAVAVFVWGWRGPHSTRAARWMLGVALIAMAASYWWQLVADLPPPFEGPAQLRRAAAILFYPAMIWVALAGMRQLRRQVAHVGAVLDAALGEGDEGDGGDI
jgi:hypothetical protein